MDRTPVASSDIAEIGYDKEAIVLEILFHSEGIYQYFDVPEWVYQGLLTAESVGKFFHANVKDIFRYTRL